MQYRNINNASIAKPPTRNNYENCAKDITTRQHKREQEIAQIERDCDLKAHTSYIYSKHPESPIYTERNHKH